jgi:hypothetical protein
MIRPEDYDKDIKRRCGGFGIPISFYPANTTVSYSNTIVCFNFGRAIDSSNLCEETKLVREALIDLGLDSIHSEVNNEEESADGPTRSRHPLDEDTEDTIGDSYKEETMDFWPDKIRGAKQRHFGFSSNYNLCRLSEEEGGLVSPRLVGGGVT